MPPFSAVAKHDRSSREDILGVSSLGVNGVIPHTLSVPIEFKPRPDDALLGRVQWRV
eukprot:CAMPEP_0115173764 /NCGR_PEP_ID=MMETSP0270-20121206/3492_1 /TAXON_ID=71861 /ORGANISM="Scrippsiella trochoidea, Strain CCMP3099" /LENGTH=56 /DNA_ID=CAMNT_0002586583 /DNA_START=505 /DNA_END=675 /DNA_ORIENTATION=+